MTGNATVARGIPHRRYCQAMVELLSGVFGGWANFTQGAAGAMLGVIGAYWIAAVTARREIRREKTRAQVSTKVDRNVPGPQPR